MEVLSKETIDKIRGYWNYDYPSAGVAAWKLLDTFADFANRKVKFKIQGSGIINDLLEFLDWKSNIETLSTITVFNQWDKNNLVTVITNLLNDNKLDVVSFLFESEVFKIRGINYKFSCDFVNVKSDIKDFPSKGLISNIDVKHIPYQGFSIDLTIKQSNGFSLFNKKNIKFQCGRIDLR